MTATAISLNWNPGETISSTSGPTNQQTYLERAYQAIREEILPAAPATCLVSYGFPKGRSGKLKRIGECWTAPTPAGVASVIFVHPCQWTAPGDVLHVLAHEMCHSATPGEGHKGKFATLARSIGLKGKLTATEPSAELRERLNAIAYRLGDFPAAAFDDMAPTKKQTTRLRLYLCQCDADQAKEEGRTNKIRCGSDQLDVTCNVCEAVFEMQEEKGE